MSGLRLVTGKGNTMRNVSLFLIIIFVIPSCQKNINVHILKEPGSIVGYILPLGIEATVELYQGKLVDQVDTDEDGYFYFNDIPPGVYYLKVKASGYGSKRKDRIRVYDGEGYDIGFITLGKLPYPLEYVRPLDGEKNVQKNYSGELEITVQFHEQMNYESVKNSISVEPALDNMSITEQYWSSYSHQLSIKGEFKFGIEYIISIDTTAQTYSGEALEFTYTSLFETEYFSVTNFSYSKPLNDGNSSVYFQFNGDVYTTAFLEHLTINPPISLTSYYSLDDKMRIYPALCWIPDTTITFHISNDLQEVGGAYLEKDTTFSMVTPPLLVVQTSPYNNQYFISTYTYIDIYFNYLVDESTILNAISITPAVNFDISTSNSSGRSRIRLSPDSLTSETEYTVSIDTSLHDYYGGMFKDGYSFSFMTE